ncbi:hypothetical protein BDQ17DRAFT_870011 [Cyathus striatus]|nr:hypothetical protein BDQ17DRAFT_870011 [Cyathus striatus]
MTDPGLSCVNPPIHQLPDELLAEIFSRVCCGHPIMPSIRSDPIWVVQQVCMRWRAVVRNTPTLWGTIKLRRPKSHANIGTVALRVRLCLKFSGTSPLSISLPERAFSLNLPVRVYEDIANHSDRWTSLTVDWLSYDHVLSTPSVQNLIEKRGLAQLRKLTVKNAQESYFEILQSATALEDVRFFSSCDLPDASDLFPWSKVRRLTIDNCCTLSSNDIISVLSTVPSLEVLTWKDSSIWLLPSQPEAHRVIVLPCLKTLTIQHSMDHLQTLPNTMVSKMFIPFGL